MTDPGPVGFSSSSEKKLEYGWSRQLDDDQFFERLTRNVLEIDAEIHHQFAHDPDGSHQLSFAYFGGVYDDGAAWQLTANGTLPLPDNTAAIYIERHLTSGAVAQNLVGWTYAGWAPMSLVTTVNGEITDVLDRRPHDTGSGGGGGGGCLTFPCLAGTILDAQVPASAVTQHAGALNPLLDHGILQGLADDDHLQYLLLAGRAGGQVAIGGTLTTEALTIQDNVVDTRQVVWGLGSWMPGTNATYDLGLDLLRWRTLFLQNDGGVIIDVPDALAVGGAGGPAISYTMELGGGFTGIGTGGGQFTFEFASTVGGGENICTFDLGAVYYAGGVGTTNDFVIICDNGLDIHRFIAKFGGWTLPEYGWALDRITGVGEAFGKTLFFDNQEPVSDNFRSIDFRINSVNILEIENSQIVNFPLRNVSAPTGLIVNGFASLHSQTIFGFYDVFQVSPVSPNAGGIFSLKPDGTSATAATLNTSAQSGTDYGALESSISGSIARLATWRLATGIGVAELRIGEMASAFFGVGILDTLTQIDFYFAGAVEMQIQPDTLVFNNGGVDTQLDWGTDGELGLQVATNDIVRIDVDSFKFFERLDANHVLVVGVAHTAADEHVILCDDDAAGAAITVTLPPAATSNAIYEIKKLGTTANVIIDGNGAETIDGALTVTLAVQYASVTIYSDGSGWHIL